MHKFNIKNIEKLDNPERRKMMPPDETLLKFKIEDNGTFLDIGCAIGYFTIPAAKILKNNKVIGIDIIPEIIGIAKEKAQGIRNIQFRTSEEYNFPVENNSIKYVLISNVLHEIEDINRYFKEIKRVLKEDGYLLIIDWEKRETEFGPPIHERISSNEMVALCDKAGLNLVDNIQINANQYGLKFEKIK